MLTHDVNYTHTKAEFAEMRALLIHNCAASPQPLSWRLAEHENWNYASRYDEPLAYFTDRVHLWRNEAGELAGFAIRYYNTTHLHAHPAHEGLADEMLAWAEDHWAGEKRCVETITYPCDAAREGLLRQRGYEDQGVNAFVRIYDLAQGCLAPVWPAGFRLGSMAECPDCTPRLALEGAVWGRTFDEPWFRGKASSPIYAPEWDLIAVSPEGQPVAACLVWINWPNRTAEIDPLGTHPAYRRRGLARTLMLEAMTRLHRRGICYLYIASEPDPDAAPNRLYASLQPMETHLEHRWVKRFTDG